MGYLYYCNYELSQCNSVLSGRGRGPHQAFDGVFGRSSLSLRLSSFIAIKQQTTGMMRSKDTLGKGGVLHGPVRVCFRVLFSMSTYARTFVDLQKPLREFETQFQLEVWNI
jgi:hypothetical protein